MSGTLRHGTLANASKVPELLGINAPANPNCRVMTGTRQLRKPPTGETLGNSWHRTMGIREEVLKAIDNARSATSAIRGTHNGKTLLGRSAPSAYRPRPSQISLHCGFSV